MAIQKEFIIRHRGEGHLRFQVPQRALLAGDVLTDALAALDGVRSVKLYRGSRKLAIHFQPERSSPVELARHMFQLLTNMEQQGLFNLPPVSDRRASSGVTERFKHSRVGRWLDDKLLAAKETAQAARVIGKISSKGPRALIQNPEKAVIDFLNDILVLYLIKVHWNRITQQWLVRPLTHRYEWLATFYLFFLLVRSRRPK